MLTNQGNTQVYSPFGSYVVEQHGPGCEWLPRSNVPEPRADKRPQPVQQELRKAA
jgi:hypothetical protein